MRSPSVVFGCFIGALAGLAGLNSGCEKLAAGLIAPSPGEFVQALRNRKAEADRKAWKPMRGRALLARNPREAFGRCVGKLDGALQNCLQSASRLENASLLLLEACEQGTSENARPRECTEFAMVLSLDEKGLSSCNQAFAAQWTACVVSRAIRRTAPPAQATLLHALQVFARLDEGFAKPNPLPPEFPKLAPSLEVATTLSPALSLAITPSLATDEIDADDQKKPEALSALTEEAFKKACTAALPDKEVSPCEDLAPDAARGSFTAEAALACLSLTGEPKDPRHTADCLSRVRDRIQTASGLRACGQAFDPEHPGYLFFYKGCIAQSGFRTFNGEEQAILAAELQGAAALDGPSRFALRERYDEIARKVREEIPVVETED